MVSVPADDLPFLVDLWLGTLAAANIRTHMVIGEPPRTKVLAELDVDPPFGRRQVNCARIRHSRTGLWLDYQLLS